MKLKNITTPDITLEEFKTKQWRRGLPLSIIGLFVYAILRLFRQRPKDYCGICKYFEIGHNLGGFEMGWFFVCSKDFPDERKNHEVGHAVQNAMRGGFTMLFCCIGSALRFWYRRIFKITTDYDAWWFEGNATKLGNEFVRRYKK